MRKEKYASPNSAIFKVALLSISVLLMLGPAVSATVPEMSKTFANQSRSAVESIASIPNFGMIFGIFLGSILAIRWGAKQTVLLGVAGSFIFGLVPVFSSSYPIVLGSRFLLGVSLGLFNSLAISLFSNYYSGNELSTLMGFQSATQSLGNSLFSFAVGYLLIFSWHAAYWIYAIALPVFFLFGRVIPPIKPQADTTNGQTTKVKQHINLNVVRISIFAFFIFSFYMVITVKLAGILTSEKIGTASDASAILGGYTLVAMVVGFLYGFIFKLMHRAVMPVGLILMALGFFAVTQFHTLLTVTLAVMLIGVGYSIANPYLFTIINTLSPKGSQNLASSVMLICLNIGAFTGPIWVNALASLLGNTSTNMDLMICVVGLALLVVWTIFIQLTHHPKEQAAK